MVTHEQKFFAILSYIFGISILAPLLIYFVVNDTYVRKHSKQSIIFHLAIYIFLIFGALSIAVLTAITFGLLQFLFGLGFFIGKLLYILFIVYICYQIWVYDYIKIGSKKF